MDFTEALAIAGTDALRNAPGEPGSPEHLGYVRGILEDFLNLEYRKGRIKINPEIKRPRIHAVLLGALTEEGKLEIGVSMMVTDEEDTNGSGVPDTG